MSVYYLKGQSNYGDSAGLTGYYYPLYTDASLISGKYHTHTFVGLDDVVFYMPSSEMNHATFSEPTGAYGGSAYQEYAKYNISDEGVISYTDLPTGQTQQIISVASYASQKLKPAKDRVTNNESTRVEDLIPVQLRESSETLISLLSDYYNYLNQQDQASDIFNRIVSEQDIDSTSLNYLDRLQNEIAKTVPESRTLNKVSLYKRIIKYYSIRGSEESVLVFFRIFFDELVEVLYPKDFLLKPSDGKWKPSDIISYYTNYFSGTIDNNKNLNEENFSEENLNDLISFRDANSAQITTGQITRIEKESPSTINHPIINNHILEIDARQSERYDSTDENAPTFKPYSPFTLKDAQANAVLKNGVRYSSVDGFSFSANPGGRNRSGNHIEVGQIYQSESVTEVTDEFTMVARVKNNRVENGSGLAQIFNDTDGYPSHSLGFIDGKLGASFYRWGSFYGYNFDGKKGSTDVPISEWSTIAVKGKRDPSANSSPAAGVAAGNGYVEVSVNGETWERIWDDSNYGTPNSFNINNVFSSNSVGNPFNYSITNFYESGTHNGKPKYVTTTAVNSEGDVTAYNLFRSGVTEYNIKFYTSLGSGTGGYGFAENYYQEDIEGVYGYWVLSVNKSGNETALVIWIDIGPDVFVYESTTTSDGRRNIQIRSQFPYSQFLQSTSPDIGEYVGNGNYGGNGPNNSGAARTNFFDVIKDFNRLLSNDGYNKRYPIHHFQRQTNFMPSSEIEASFESNDKILTWKTTKELLDVKDNTGPLRLGINRFTNYYQGDLLHFSYFNKLVSQSDLTKIHDYYFSFKETKWGLRIDPSEDVSLLNVRSITDLTNTVYELSNLSGHKINSFWTYDENKFGSVLTNFKIKGTGGTINWGDGSIPTGFFDDIVTQHTFGPSTQLQGSYDNRKGFLSDVMKLQDSNYWQDYSYEIRSGLQSSDWINEYLRLVHPAGMKLFAALLLQIVRKNIWTGYKEWREDSPQREDQLKRWLEKLIPPSRNNSISEDGYHMPFYQPGWLSSDAEIISLISQALVFAGANSRSGSALNNQLNNIFERTAFLSLLLGVGPNAFNRNQIVLNNQLKSQKFLDSNVRCLDYGYLTANELNNSEVQISPSQSHESNLLVNLLPWSYGSGSDNEYGDTPDLLWQMDGNSTENLRTYRTDPFGNETNIVWVGGDDDADGGFISPIIDIDASQNKTYRFSVWIKHQNTRKSTFGLFARDTSGDITANDSIIKLTPDTLVNTVESPTNIATQFPHFHEGRSLPANNAWYLVVGFLRPEDNTTTTTLSNSFGGLYDTSGNEVRWLDSGDGAVNEFKYISDVNGLRIRASSDGASGRDQVGEVEMWGPRIDVVDGNEPSVQELIFPTINSDILYGIRDRPSNKVVYKLNNFSSKIEGQIVMRSITATRPNYRTTTFEEYSRVVPKDAISYTLSSYQTNYNENLKFIDNTKIGSYYNVKISDMVSDGESDSETSIALSEVTYDTSPSYSSALFTPDYTLSVSFGGTGYYALTGSDRNGSISALNPNLTFNAGDKVRFNNSVSNAHPLYIKTAQGAGVINLASGVSGPGGTIVDWTIPDDAIGTYYYQCSVHNAMYGEISVRGDLSIAANTDSDLIYSSNGVPLIDVDGNLLTLSGINISGLNNKLS